MFIPILSVAFEDCNPANVCKKNSRSSSFFIPGLNLDAVKLNPRNVF